MAVADRLGEAAELLFVGMTLQVGSAGALGAVV